MIAKDTTTTVNFYAMTTAGLAATGQASNITASISTNGGTATTFSGTISEKDSVNQPGWYKFSYTFSTAGNVFITFTCTGCIIEPWEDEVVEMAASSGPTAAQIADAVWDEDITAHVDTRNKPLGYMVFYMDYIPQNVWGYSFRTLQPSFPSASSIASEVWINSSRTLTTAVATSTQVTSAKNEIITAMPDVSGLSTFDPSTDDVNVSTTSISNIQSGLATSSNVSTAQTAIINAMPSTSGLATASDVSTAQAAIIAAMPDVSGLSTFDPASTNVNVSSTSISDIQSGLATSSNVSTAQTAIINAMPSTTGLATSANVSAAQTAIINAMPSTSGLATSADITAAITEIETHGDENWRGGSGPSGGITAEDVWKYSGTYGRTLTASPTDITSLATKTDLTGAQTAIINAMPDVSGLSTFDPATDDVNVSTTSIANIAAGIWGDVSEYTGSTKGAVLSTIASDVDTMPASIWSADLTGYSGSTAGHQIYNALNNCATSTDTAVIAAELEEVIGGVMNWYVTANTLTVYSPSNTVLKTYSITRDVEGNIVSIQPNN